MLVISRKPGESLLIGDNIRITILSVSGDKVAVGIEAPREINVARQELTETIEANQASAEKVGSEEYKGIALLLKNKRNVKKDTNTKKND